MEVRRKLPPGLIKAEVARIFKDGTVTQTGNRIVVSHRVEMNQNIEVMLSKPSADLFSLMLNTAEEIHFQCDVKDNIGVFKITLAASDSLGGGAATFIETNKGIKSYEEYRREIDEQNRRLMEALGKLRLERESYRVSEDFDKYDEESVRKEAIRMFEWFDDQAEKYKGMDFLKMKRCRELAKLVKDTNFGVFEKEISDPKPDEDHSGSLIALTCEFDDRDSFQWNLTGDLKDAFADMISLSDGLDIIVGLYDDERSIEFLLGVNDVYVKEFEN